MALVMYGVSNQYDIPLLYLKLRIYAQFQIISPPLLTGERRSIGFKGTMTSCAHRRIPNVVRFCSSRVSSLCSLHKVRWHDISLSRVPGYSRGYPFGKHPLTSPPP